MNKCLTLSHTNQKRGKDIYDTKYESAKEGGKKTCDVKSLDDAAYEIEDEAVDHQGKQTQGKDIDRKRQDNE